MPVFSQFTTGTARNSPRPQPPMFELGRATLAQAAEVAGYSVRGFMDVLGHHGIPVVNYPASELASEIAW
jgi:predicted HTH domain antitoxin